MLSSMDQVEVEQVEVELPGLRDRQELLARAAVAVRLELLALRELPAAAEQVAHRELLAAVDLQGLRAVVERQVLLVAVALLEQMELPDLVDLQELLV